MFSYVMGSSCLVWMKDGWFLTRKHINFVFSKTTVCHYHDLRSIARGVPKTKLKTTSRAVPQKRCSPPISSWLGNFEKIHSSLEIWVVCGKQFFYKFLVIEIIISKLNTLAYNYLIICNMQDTICNLFILNISIFAKGVPFLFQAGKKWRNGPAGLEKRNTKIRHRAKWRHRVKWCHRAK